MSWTDRTALQVINQLRDFYEIEQFVETGTFKGINAQVQSKNFRYVETCELDPEMYALARARMEREGITNVWISQKDSAEFLKDVLRTYSASGRKDNVIFYLDAHFYNPKGPRWQVQRELRALKGFKKAVIVIHDFNNNLGHCVYDEERLGMNVVGKLLKKVNPNFHFYTNNLESCDIIKPEEVADPDMQDNLKYAWSSPRRTYRGILYCTPTKLPKSFGLVKCISN